MTTPASRATASLARKARLLAALAGALGGLAAPTLAQEKAVPVPGTGGQPKTTVKPAGSSLPGRNGGPGAKPGVPTNPNPGRPTPPVNPNTPKPGAESDPGHAEVHEVPDIDAGDGDIEFSGFSEAVELTTLVEIVAKTLKINIYSDPNLSGSIVFNAPVKVKKDKLLDMLRAWLGIHNYTLTYDKRTEFYAVLGAGTDEIDFEDKLTTRVFVTEGIRPSSLKSMIDGLLGSGTASVVGGGAAKGGRQPNPQQPGGVDENGMPIQAQPGGAGGKAGGGSGRIVYNDELGVIIMHDTIRRIEAVDTVVQKVVEEYARITVSEIPLSYVAPAVAKQRILEMLGQIAQQTGRQNNRGNVDEYGNPIQQNPQANAAKTTMDNLAERLTVSPNGNSLFFRGKKEELDNVKDLIAQIDKQSLLEPFSYTVGASAKAIADIARQRGMGEVTTIRSQDETNRFAQYGYIDYGQQRGQQNQQQQLTGGPVMVVDEGRGQIIYYATEKLHDEMARLIEEISPEDDAIVMREYRLYYAKADKLAQTILGLINNQTPAGEGNNNSNLLPSGGGRNGGFNQPIIVTPPFYGNSNDLSISGKNSFVIADEANNQVIVKAPLKEQAYYRELVSRLDLAVPQVYVEAQIVTVTGSDEFKLAFETQLINAGGSGGVVNTNFGLSSFASGAGLNSRKTVATGLKGGTGALIKSDQVPIIVNALQTQTESRVLSTPKLLVDANAEESSVESNDEQPTAQTNLSNSAGGNDIVSFGGYEKAGTKLVVKKPQIGPGDAVRMEVEVELSSFTGAASGNLPPPKFTNNIKSQVQVPANMTVVIGGVAVNTKRNTTDKIPLLGDIPLFGALFQSQSKFKSDTTLYVFLTPRVQRDPKYGDLSLTTLPALKAAGLDPNIPAIKPILVDFIEIREPSKAPAPDAAPPAADKTPADKDKPGA